VASAEDGASRGRVVIADDHSVVRTGLRLLVEHSGWLVVGEAADVPETARQVDERRPDVLLLDLHMPGGSTQDLIRDLAARGHPRVLVLTVDEHAASVRAALRAGAGGYMPKDASATELLDALRRVAAGEEYVSPRLGASLFNPEAERVAAMADEDREVLRLIALGHTAKEIAGILNSTQRHVEWQRKRLQRALDAHTRADLVRVALDEGLVDRDGVP
jgi:two-component system, NarL family, response regulator NreC